jgi:1,4-alpha-glucan branching enzyme
MGNLGAIHARSEPHGDFPACAEILLPPLSTLFFEFESDGLQ